MDIKRNPNKEKWTNLKLYSVQSQPQISSLGISKGQKQLQGKVRRQVKKKKRDDVLLSAKQTNKQTKSKVLAN